MRMEKGLDTGPVCLSAQTAISPQMSAGQLHDDLMVRGAALMVEALEHLQNGTLSCTPQPESGITYASKIEKSETRIDWSRPAQDVHNHIRGLSPFPGAWFEIEVKGRKERIKVLQSQLENSSGQPGFLLDDQLLVACGEKSVRLVTLQRAGKKAMGADELLRGLPMAAGLSI
jgi:methionyl-tRNA formyltransferase